MPLRIAHYHLDMKWSVGGVMRAVLDLCAVLARRGQYVQLMTCYPDDLPAEWMRGGDGLPRVTVLNQPGVLHRLNRNALDMAAKVIADADVVHLHAPWTTSNVQLAHIARRLGKPYVLTIHGMLDDWSMAQRRLKKQIYLLLAGRSLLDHAAAIHCTAAAELEQARKWFSSPRTIVLPLLFDLTELIELPGPELARQQFEAFRSREPKVLFLSRLHPKKGVDLLLEAAALLRQRNVPLRVVIAGEGTPAYKQSLRQLARKLGIEEVTSFLGLVKGPLKFSIYQASDLFVLPTSQENYGLVLPESLACCTPAITTKGVDIWQELQEVGVMIVDRAPEALVNAMANLLLDENRRHELGERGRNWVLEHLEPQHLAEKYEQLYADCIGR